jgi:hypothetical protein
MQSVNLLRTDAQIVTCRGVKAGVDLFGSPGWREPAARLGHCVLRCGDGH